MTVIPIPTSATIAAWGGKSSDEDMEVLIRWFQSSWSDEKYPTWPQMDAEIPLEPGHNVNGIGKGC